MIQQTALLNQKCRKQYLTKQIKIYIPYSRLRQLVIFKDSFKFYFHCF